MQRGSFKTAVWVSILASFVALSIVVDAMSPDDITRRLPLYENHDPTIQSVDPTDAQMIFLGGSVALRVNATDEDSMIGENITFSWVARDAGNSTVGGLGTPVASGGNPASGQVTFTPTGTGTFSVTATAGDGIGGTASHTFTVVVTCWDILELNNGIANATVVASNTTVDYHNLSICGVDVDVFALEVAINGGLEVELRRPAPSMQITITLCYIDLDLSNAICLVTGISDDTTVTLIASDLGTGTYYIHIGATENAVDVYDITITSTEP